MTHEIVPVTRSLFLCDFYVGYQDSRVDLYGILNAIRAPSYPYLRPRLCAFAQLVGGIGTVPFHFEVVRERDNEVIRVTQERTLNFPDRLRILQLAVTMEGIRFDEAGVYQVSLFCYHQWMCDTTFVLR